MDFVLNIRTVTQEGYVQGWGGGSPYFSHVRVKYFRSFGLKFDHSFCYFGLKLVVIFKDIIICRACLRKGDIYF